MERGKEPAEPEMYAGHLFDVAMLTFEDDRCLVGLDRMIEIRPARFCGGQERMEILPTELHDLFGRIIKLG
jgi:hypothetical protein